MALSAGTRLGPYEVIAVVGAGGMGEVYRARDRRLDRTVAIKVLPPQFAADPQFRARFDREARAISALDHPNICTVYDVGEHDGLSFLVMQFLEGETLAQRLERGAAPISEALTIAIQMADALDKAHRAGLTHRDLKPGNIFLVRGGGPSRPTAKLLDFGLAKHANAQAAGDLSVAPTLGAPLTGQGTIVGTLQYMAPEQLEGRSVDSRTDLFAFGAVLYETVTGRRAFEGRSQASLISAILKDDPPPIASLQPLAPPSLDRVVKKCLAKDPDYRWQTARDLLDELKWVAETASQPGPASSVAHDGLVSGVGSQVQPRPKGMPLARSAAAVLFMTTVVLAAAMYVRREPLDTRVYRSSFVPPARLIGFPAGRLALSPDGQRLAFTAPSGDGRLMLWIRALDSLTASPLAGTDNAGGVFWSPDSRFVAFFADRKLKKIDVSGGPPLTLCDGEVQAPGTWSRDDVILFTPSLASGLSRVAAAGGTPAPVTMIDGKNELAHAMPHFLPDGRHFLYAAVVPVTQVGSAGAGPVASAGPVVSRVYVASLDSAERKLILEGASNVYFDRGFLIFSRGTTLMAQPFDAATLTLGGQAGPLAEQVQIDTVNVAAAAYSISATGVLAFETGRPAGGSRLLWVDRTGKRIGALGEPARYGSEVNLSPDGRHASVVAADSGSARDVWIFDMARGIRTKFTFDPADDREPIWSPDGTRIVFNRTRMGALDLYQKAASGAGTEELLLADGFQKWPESWSPDGRFLLYFVAGPISPPNMNDLWVLPLSGDKKPFPFVQSASFVEQRSQFSPDGRWVAYASNESGRFEVYLTPFPGPGGKFLVSTAGGNDPRWRRDGREIFYVSDGDKQMMATPVTANGSTVEVGAARPLFNLPALPTDQGRAFYDVSADGQRFLVNTVEEQAGVAPITVVVNWPALLRR